MSGQMIEAVLKAYLLLPTIALMPSHTYKPNLTDLRNAALLVESETRYTVRGPKERRILREPSRSVSPRKRAQRAPACEDTQVPVDLDPLTGNPDMDLEPLKITKTKVCSMCRLKVTSDNHADTK